MLMKLLTSSFVKFPLRLESISLKRDSHRYSGILTKLSMFMLGPLLFDLDSKSLIIFSNIVFLSESVISVLLLCLDKFV